MLMRSELSLATALVIRIANSHDMINVKKLQNSTKNMKLSTTQQLPVSLSYDHRIINGVYAMTFINKLNEYLNDVNFLQSSFD